MHGLLYTASQGFLPWHLVRPFDSYAPSARDVSLYSPSYAHAHLHVQAGEVVARVEAQAGRLSGQLERAQQQQAELQVVPAERAEQGRWTVNGPAC
jgi:hypothetical protein